MIKVAFIICYNNELYMKECMEYISWLKVPEGVETEIIGIVEAESMAAGYNAAMHASDARYKVYLHQDVFILNENFIEDMLHIFEMHPDYGLLGVLGSNKIEVSGNYCLNWNVGRVYADDARKAELIERDNPDELWETAAVDGMVMMTQYDVEWREDIFDGFDFYDISQSIEFQKAGYKVGVPHQELPWCNHVCGQSKMERYDDYRRILCEEYREFGYCYSSNGENEVRNIKNREVEKRLPLIRETLEKGELDRMTALLETVVKFYPHNTELCNLQAIDEIIWAGRRSNDQNGFYRSNMSVAELMEKYILCKFLMKRLEHEKPIDSLHMILEMIAESDVGNLEAEKVIAKHAVINVKRVIWKLKYELQKICEKPFYIQFDDEIFVLPKEENYGKVRDICTDIQSFICNLRGMGESIQYNIDGVELTAILEKMERTEREYKVGRVSENVYMAYFEVMEKHRKLSAFFEECQKWAEGVLQYINRKERQPLVSVLVSVYNGEDFVEDTLRSIMGQSYQNLQIIVIDDCSSDNSREIIHKLAQCDKRIEPLYLEENSHVCKAVNMGYKLVRGKYVALCGHDDIWKAEKIEKQVNFLEMYTQYAACFTLVNLIDEEKKECNDKAPDLYGVFNQRNRSQKEWIKELLFVGNLFCAPSAVIRRECIKSEYIYCFGSVQLQDMVLWLELLTDSPLYILQERLTLYRKFLKSNGNLSAWSEKTRNRLKHEFKYVLVNYIKKIPDEKFKWCFSEDFKDPNAKTAAELKCERAFLVQKTEEMYCIDMFMELFEEEETRELLEKKYHFKLTDFYELNARSFSYDDETKYQLRDALETIRQYQILLQRQNAVIEEQKRLLEK